MTPSQREEWENLFKNAPAEHFPELKPATEAAAEAGSGLGPASDDDSSLPQPVPVQKFVESPFVSTKDQVTVQDLKAGLKAQTAISETPENTNDSVSSSAQPESQPLPTPLLASELPPNPNVPTQRKQVQAPSLSLPAGCHSTFVTSFKSFKLGSTVRIKGLKSEQGVKLNGLTAVVKEMLMDAKSIGRWRVEVIGEGVKSLKGENLEEVTSSEDSGSAGSTVGITTPSDSTSTAAITTPTKGSVSSTTNPIVSDSGPHTETKSKPQQPNKPKPCREVTPHLSFANAAKAALSEAEQKLLEENKEEDELDGDNENGVERANMRKFFKLEEEAGVGEVEVPAEGAVDIGGSGEKVELGNEIQRCLITKEASEEWSRSVFVCVCSGYPNQGQKKDAGCWQTDYYEVVFRNRPSISNLYLLNLINRHRFSTWLLAKKVWSNVCTGVGNVKQCVQLKNELEPKT